jgi:hypothetical protein
MNLLKVFALIMIGLLIIIVGIRFAYVETHLFPLNEEQKAFATKAARDGLKDEIEGKDYNITAADRGWIISTTSGDKKVAFVVFTYGNTTLSVLVDMETGNVVKKSRVEYSDWMTEYKYPEPWAHKRLFR